MTIKGKAYIVGAYEHPLRKAPDKSVAQLHAEVGRYAKSQGIERLKTVGTLAASASHAFDGAQHFESFESLLSAVRSDLSAVTSVLVKGSRFMRMERVVEALHAH